MPYRLATSLSHGTESVISRGELYAACDGLVPRSIFLPLSLAHLATSYVVGDLSHNLWDFLHSFMEGFWPATAIRQKERGKKRAHARAFMSGRGDRKTFSYLMLGCYTIKNQGCITNSKREICHTPKTPTLKKYILKFIKKRMSLDVKWKPKISRLM